MRAMDYGSIMNEKQKSRFEESSRWTSIGLRGRAPPRPADQRVHAARGVGMAAADSESPLSLEELWFPPGCFTRLRGHRRRLVLSRRGPTSGSGKSTSLAAIIDHINKTRAGHILTIEDPIEFVTAHVAINQRERRVTPSPSRCA